MNRPEPGAVGPGSSSSKKRWPLTRYRTCPGLTCTVIVLKPSRRFEPPGKFDWLIFADLRNLRVSLAGRWLEQQAVVSQRRFGPRPVVRVDREFKRARERIVEKEQIGARARQMRDQPSPGPSSRWATNRQPSGSRIRHWPGATTRGWWISSTLAGACLASQRFRQLGSHSRQSRAAAGLLGTFRERFRQPPAGTDHGLVRIGKRSATRAENRSRRTAAARLRRPPRRGAPPRRFACGPGDQRAGSGYFRARSRPRGFSISAITPSPPPRTSSTRR